MLIKTNPPSVKAGYGPALQARSKQCLIGPAMVTWVRSNLSSGAQGTFPAPKCILSKK